MRGATFVGGETKKVDVNVGAYILARVFIELNRSTSLNNVEHLFFITRKHLPGVMDFPPVFVLAWNRTVMVEVTTVAAAYSPPTSILRLDHHACCCC